MNAQTKATPLVEMKDVSIAFGGIKAVDHASVDLYPGEVVGLLGHNGAGKSTLIKVLSGAYKRDGGTIFINGEEAHISNPRDAKKYGIETIYQTLALADNLGAAANIFLGRELLTRWGQHLRKMMSAAGFEPTTSCTQNRRADQAAPRPDIANAASIMRAPQ